MNATHSNSLFRYGSALIAVALATGVRMLLDPRLDDAAPLSAYFAAIMFTAWYGGLGPSVSAIILSIFLADFFFIEPRGSIYLFDWVPFNTEHEANLVLFIGVSLVIVFLSNSLRASRERAEVARAELAVSEARRREQVETELAKVKDRLVRQTRLAAIGQVSASIAHDLRGPLATMSYAIGLLRETVGDGKTSVEYLDLIAEEIKNTDRIISNLMSMVRDKPAAKQPVNVGPLVCGVFDRLGRGPTVRLRLDLAPDPFWISSDPSQLEQVFGNLLANATHAMPDGGEIRVRARRGKSEDHIVVEDDGPGIAPEMRERIFEPLVTSKPQGFGLGLAICQQIIEHHGGRIELLPTDRRGAAFEIRLPSAS